MQRVDEVEVGVLQKGVENQARITEHERRDWNSDYNPEPPQKTPATWLYLFKGVHINTTIHLEVKVPVKVELSSRVTV